MLFFPLSLSTPHSCQFVAAISPIFKTVTYYTPFLQEVWDKKPEIEQAFHMEEPVTLDSGEGTLEHSTHHLPQPPPRHESYLLKNADGSGSENYEHLPTRSLNSLNGGDDSNINFNLNDNNEKYPHLYMLDGKDMGIDDTYMNDDDKDEKSRLIHQGNFSQFIQFHLFMRIKKKIIDFFVCFVDALSHYNNHLFMEYLTIHKRY